MRRRLLAEMFGTFTLVFAGTGAIIINDISGGVITNAGVALTFGVVVTVLICSLGDVSGAHLNPAVTVGFLVARRNRAPVALAYIASQCAGALLASLLLRLIFPHHPTLGATLPAGTAVGSAALEILLTTILMYVVLSTSGGSRRHRFTAATIIGAVIGIEAYLAGPISGASMNPARSLAPALLSGHIEALWVYLSAPFLGAVAAVVICRQVHRDDCCRTNADEGCRTATT